MKIGILTHHYVSNYGAFLQAYTLLEAVSKAFPEDTVEVINYINIKHYLINAGGWFRYYPDKESLKCWLKKLRVPGVFGKARKQHLRCSPLCFTAAQINRQGYDVIIVGSDEVWNYQDRKSGAKVKFGHGLTCPNIIAYAPSVGKSDGEIPEYVRSGILKFQALSARDGVTGQMVAGVTGREPVQVLDPTFLAEVPKKNLRLQEPYILFYYCDGLDAALKDRILSYAKQHKMAVYGAGECHRRYTETTVDIDPFTWAQMFRQAEYVFTGTFHGAVFSVLNRKQFWVHLTNPSRIRKVECLLRALGIESRRLDHTWSAETAEMIDYEAVNARLDEQRKSSMCYLRGAISAAKAHRKDP